MGNGNERRGRFISLSNKGAKNKCWVRVEAARKCTVGLKLFHGRPIPFIAVGRCCITPSRLRTIFVFEDTLPIRRVFSLVQPDRVLQAIHRQAKDLLSETPYLFFCSRVRSRSCVSGSRWGRTASRRVKGILRSEHQLGIGIHDDSFLRVLERIC